MQPGQAMNFAQQGYGTQANIFGQQQQALTAQRGQNINFMSDLAGGAMGFGGALWGGGA